MKDFSILPMIRRRLNETRDRRPPLPDDADAIRLRVRETRRALSESLGVMPDRVVDPLLEVEAEVELSDAAVIHERIVYRTEEDVWVPAHVYRPADPPAQKLPAVLLLQGWDLDKYSLGQFKLRLAEAGYVVLFPDNRFSGERRRAADGQAEQCNLLPVSGLFGLTFMGMNTWDNMRALDVLADREDVDDQRLATVGLCWGGMQAYVLAALDARVRAVCPTCSVSTFDAIIREYVPHSAGHTCFGTYLWQWAEHGDVQDILACIAPRPMLIQNNVNDYWFPISGMIDVVNEMKRVYGAMEASDRFCHEVEDTVHDITVMFGERIIDWLDRFMNTAPVTREGGFA